MIGKILSAGWKAEVLQITFTAGAITGMLIEALFFTMPKVAFLIWGMLHV